MANCHVCGHEILKGQPAYIDPNWEIPDPYNPPIGHFNPADHKPTLEPKGEPV